MLFWVKKITEFSNTESTLSCSAFVKRPRTMGATLRRVSSVGSSMGMNPWERPAARRRTSCTSAPRRSSCAWRDRSRKSLPGHAVRHGSEVLPVRRYLWICSATSAEALPISKLLTGETPQSAPRAHRQSIREMEGRKGGGSWSAQPEDNRIRVKSRRAVLVSARGATHDSRYTAPCEFLDTQSFQTENRSNSVSISFDERNDSSERASLGGRTRSTE